MSVKFLKFRGKNKKGKKNKKLRIEYQDKPRKKKKPKKSSKKKLFLKIIIGLFVLGLLSVVGIFAFYATQLPNPEKIEERTIKESTKIFDSSGEHLLYEAGEIKRTRVDLKKVSPYLQKATITAEDDSFYQHPGIAVKSILRALWANLTNEGDGLQGGSTITQQFIKNVMFLERNKEGDIIGPAPRTIPRKIKEAILSLELERRYSKDQILEFYLNQVSYGSNYYGIEAASENYFGKSAKDLSLAEAATLASLTRAPTHYLKNDQDRRIRKNWILNRMVSLDFVKEEKAEKAKEKEIELTPSEDEQKAPYFLKEVRNRLREKYGEEYKRMGLEVYTTLDYNLQKKAKETISQRISKNEERYGAENAAITTIDPQTGQILAMQGGRDFSETEVNIWTASEGISFQSPGSAFKPIVYTTAFKEGYTPRTMIWDVRTVFNKKKPDWPRNFDHKQRGPVKLKEGLAQSLNIPAVKTLYLAGLEKTINTAKSMGMIKSFDPDLDETSPNLSMAIGGKNVVPLELIGAYGVFATEGERHPLHYIEKVVNNKGKAIYNPSPQTIKVLDKQVCRQINSILSNNELRSPAFGSRSWLYLAPWAAAKTGTATNNDGDVTDAWTIGYTKDLVTGVWTGKNSNNALKDNASGSKVAGPIWWKFMEEATKDKEHEGFTPPKKVNVSKPILKGEIPTTTKKVDKVSGKLATSSTPEELIQQKEFYKAHSILWYVNKNNPRGDYPENPSSDPMFEKWEEGVNNWIKSKGGKYSAPQEKDDLHTPEKQPEINLLSEEGGETQIEFEIKIEAPLEIKKVEVFYNNEKIATKKTSKEKHLFSFNVGELGEKEEYQFSIKVTDRARNQTQKKIAVERQIEDEETTDTTESNSDTDNSDE